jgi:hypothetical protein
VLWHKEAVTEKFRKGTPGSMAQRSSDRNLEKIPSCFHTKKQREELREGTHGVMTESSSDREISEWNTWCYGTRKHW